MNAKQMTEVIDKVGLLHTEGIEVMVQILDVKQAYGNLRYVVSPVMGNGKITVSADRVKIAEGV